MLKFDPNFHIETDVSCTYDYVTVYSDGNAFKHGIFRQNIKFDCPSVLQMLLQFLCRFCKIAKPGTIIYMKKHKYQKIECLVSLCSGSYKSFRSNAKHYRPKSYCFVSGPGCSKHRKMNEIISREFI